MAFHAIVSDDRDRFVFHMQTARHNRRRSISASICLLMVVLLYTPLAGAAWSSYQMACCRSGHCSIPAHHHLKTPPPPAHHLECGPAMSGMMACSLPCCHGSDRWLVAPLVLVLPLSLTVD